MIVAWRESKMNSSLGNTAGDAVAEVVIRFFPADNPKRAIGGYAIHYSVEESLHGRLDLVRYAVNALSTRCKAKRGHGSRLQLA
jgi:hypothetical protein